MKNTNNNNVQQSHRDRPGLIVVRFPFTRIWPGRLMASVRPCGARLRLSADINGINKERYLMTRPKSKQKISNAVTQTIKEVDPMSSLRTKLKAAEPEIQNYVTALEADNLKFQRQIAKFQVENVTLHNRIKVLEEEYPKKQEITLNVVHNKPPKLKG